MYTKEQYEEAIKLRKQGFTYLEIAKKLNLKTTNAVRGWTTKGQLPRGRFLNSNFDILSPELGYILGVIEGDGYVRVKKTKGHVGLDVKDKDFALFFKRQLEKWIKLPVYFRQRKDTKSYVTTLYSLRAAIPTAPCGSTISLCLLYVSLIVFAVSASLIATEYKCFLISLRLGFL